MSVPLAPPIRFLTPSPQRLLDGGLRNARFVSVSSTHVSDPVVHAHGMSPGPHTLFFGRMTMLLRSLARGLGLLNNSNAKPGRPASRRSPARRSQARPNLEGLEDRLVMNSRFVVPLETPADDTTTFHALSRALTKAGLVSGD